MYECLLNGTISKNITLNLAGMACQGQTLQLIGSNFKLRKNKWREYMFSLLRFVCITLGWNGMLGTNTLAYGAHLKLTKKIGCMNTCLAYYALCVLHQAGMACQGQTLQLIGPISKLQKISNLSITLAYNAKCKVPYRFGPSILTYADKEEAKYFTCKEQ